MREKYDISGPGKFEGETPLARFIYENLTLNGFFGNEDSATEDESLSRYGKRLLFSDSLGFIYLTRCKDVEEASAIFEDWTNQTVNDLMEGN